MEKSTIEINRIKDNHYHVTIDIKDLTYRNLLILEDSFNEFIRIREEACTHMTEQEKENGHHAYLIHPNVMLRKLLRNAILELYPTAKFSSEEVKSSLLQCSGSDFHQQL